MPFQSEVSHFVTMCYSTLSQMSDALWVWYADTCIDISVYMYSVAGIHCLLLWTIWVPLNAVTTPASFANTRISGSNVMTIWSPKLHSMKFLKVKGKSLKMFLKFRVLKDDKLILSIILKIIKIISLHPSLL